MNDLLFNSRLLGAMSEHACLTEDEEKVLKAWASGWSIAKTARLCSMDGSTVNRIRKRLRIKYDGIQPYTDLPPRK